jgi:predicted kinase
MKNTTHHFLIGLPASGKSTLAEQLAKLGAEYTIISTDQIRGELFNDESIQGNWVDIENLALSRIKAADESGKVVIYDATNCKRAYRFDFLEKANNITGKSLQWMAWQLDTPLEICQRRNQQRQRQVPGEIIDSMNVSLKQFPPEMAEGFISVKKITLTSELPTLEELEKIIKSAPRSLKTHQSRTSNYKLHQYSGLLDFERLMHLISLILKYPGIGNLQTSNPALLTSLFGELPNFDTSVDEVAAMMGKLKGAVYANTEKLEADLVWLDENGILVTNDNNAKIQVKPLEESEVAEVRQQNCAWHRYSDVEIFKRLMTLIKSIAHNPLDTVSDLSSDKKTWELLSEQAFGSTIEKDNVRREIEKVLKPYQILPGFAMKRGYFLGTGIFSERELEKVYGLLNAQKIHTDDPIALEMLQLFQDRINSSQLLELKQYYPVRVIGNRGIVNSESLPDTALPNKLSQLEEAIEQGKLLKLARIGKTARFPGQADETFDAYPLQIVFHNIAWYLGFEQKGGTQDKLLNFERLDRLRLYQVLGHSQRSEDEQRKSLKQLTDLYQSCFGIFLGNSAEDQRKFLSKNKQTAKSVSMTVELWMTENIFKFVSEGTQRLSKSQMKMSKRPNEATKDTDKSLFTLPGSGDTDLPYRWQATLPKWSIKDVDLKRWIIGFGGQVKVVEPPELVDLIKKEAEGIIQNYSE